MCNEWKEIAMLKDSTKVITNTMLAAWVWWLTYTAEKVMIWLTMH